MPYTFDLPRFNARLEDSGPLARFLTGQQIDANDGIEFVDQFAFIDNVEVYRKAYLNWKGRPDDSTAQPNPKLRSERARQPDPATPNS